ncbi:MAG: hypothetical protein Q9219_004408 [cf. Caloplaca sp. 3 TL-2023]
MSAALRSSATVRARNLSALQNPSSTIPHGYGRNAAYRRPAGRFVTESPIVPSTPVFSFPRNLSIVSVLQQSRLPFTYRTFVSSTSRSQEQQQSQRRSTDQAESSQTGRKAEDQADDKSKRSDEQTDDGRGRRKQEKKEEAPPPPPPPHGNKPVFQVFMDTLRSEFKASKEWNESTKAIASSAHQFTENESIKRARAAYTAASGAATSTTASAIKSTGKVIGQSAAWTWDTPVVKGVRTGVNATGRGFEKVTRPVRETQIYKTAVGGVKDVVDDGSSSRYGGWVEKEERRKQRELRELKESTLPGGQGRRPEKMEEDPNAGTNVTLHKDAKWKESWREFKDSSKVMQSIFSLRSTYNESENPFVSTARSITDKIAGFFAENETAMVIKKFREMDPTFQVEPFLREMREYILPEVLDAYVKGDTETLKLWLSAAQFQVYAALAQQYTAAGLKSDGRILDIRHVDILSARMLDPGEVPVFIITCRTQEVHVYRNAKTNQLAAGMEDKVQLVTYAIGVTRVPDDILLVPTTEVLLTSKDRESNSLYSDLATSEEFLASHVLRITGAQLPTNGSVRDSRGKAKQYSTINGRTIIVKESFVYSNKGFKNINQAQLLSDVLYYPDQLEAQQWLIYYISRPLLGSWEAIKITPATLPTIVAGMTSVAQDPSKAKEPRSENGPSSGPKKDIRSFSDLLNHFPMIARQMQPGLERVFKDFHQQTNQRAALMRSEASAKLSRRSSTVSSHSGSNGSIHSRFSNGFPKAPVASSTQVDEEEAFMRRTLENAVTAAIDLFQLVDKQQLSYLGSSTNLSGSAVERLIERYISEQVNDSAVFPVLCNSRKLEGLELESRIHGMEHIDIAQVGLTIEGGREGKASLLKRLTQGVEEFRKMGVAGSPQQMLEVLVETQKVVTSSGSVTNGQENYDGSDGVSEKPKMMTMNADTLVSLLLIVVIRSQVRHLQARLAYMRNFIFFDDVDHGETGYALSTFEAVLSYLATDSGQLRKASRRNKKLWQATRNGALPEVAAILEVQTLRGISGDDRQGSHCEGDGEEIDPPMPLSRHLSSERFSEAATEVGSVSELSSLAHVFPFQSGPGRSTPDPSPRRPKRVSMDVRSLSNTSESSIRSRATTIDSGGSMIESDTSVETLAQTQDMEGRSILMMAIEARQPAVLEYLLNQEDYFPSRFILEDADKDETTLLSAAVQTADRKLIEIILHHILQIRDGQVIRKYFARVDSRGRTFAHYLFNDPELVGRFGEDLPWRKKDKNGQTPLLALCRSYDHANYHEMVSGALHFATIEQGDGQPLHLDNHVDAKGNTLLHVVHEPSLALRLLRHCDSDANATNDKRFTPLMVASKYGRIDMIRVLFGDRRVDVQAKELRGMTAVELAKDDEVRNRIDDMVLVSNVPAPDGRVTAVVRSFFVEDASIRLIIKSAVRNDKGMIGITTCRRSLADFENLVNWLAQEHPASWLPSIFNFRSPFLISVRPSKAALQDIQVRLDRFLKIMLAHSTFATHELLWEFVLFPEIQPEMMEERSRKKAEVRAENIKEQYEPVDDVHDVESFVGHAREALRGVNHSTKSVMRRIANIRNCASGMYDY